MKVLLVEDEPQLASFTKKGVEHEGYELTVGYDGRAGWSLYQQQPYDLVILDVNLPYLNGVELCRHIRAGRLRVPVLMLTARGAVEDRIRGLDSGADDYLPKPFSLEELLARIRALARRGPMVRPTLVTTGDLTLDPATRRVWRGEREITLSSKEFALLETFMRRPDRVLTRDQLLEHAWDMAYESRSNVVDVYVRYLREKIDRPFGRRTLETVRGVGYRLRGDRP